MKKIRKNDEVVVLKGKDRGKQGKVLEVNASGKIKVEGINLVKKHTKPNPNLGVPGGIVEKEAFIEVSNLAVVNPDTGKADRVGFKIDENGNKQRIYKASGKKVS